MKEAKPPSIFIAFLLLSTIGTLVQEACYSTLHDLSYREVNYNPKRS